MSRRHNIKHLFVFIAEIDAVSNHLQQPSAREKTSAKILKYKALQLSNNKWTKSVVQSASSSQFSMNSLELGGGTSDDLYINANTPSLLYSDADSNGNRAATEDSAISPSVSATFSLQSLPLCDSLCLKTLKEAYCKPKETVSENSYNFHSHCSVCCSPSFPSAGSSSTPSSAYYSDVSICKVQSNRKKKKKRKVDLVLVKDRLGNFIKEPTGFAAGLPTAPVGFAFQAAKKPLACLHSLQETHLTCKAQKSEPNTHNCVHSAPLCTIYYAPQPIIKPVNLSKHNFTHFHNADSKVVPLQVHYSDLNNQVSLSTNKNIIKEIPRLKKTLNKSSFEKDIAENCNQSNQESIINQNIISLNICPQQTMKEEGQFDYDIYNCSSEMPSEYI